MGKIPESTPFKISDFVFRFKESSNKFIIEILTQNLAFNLSGTLFFIGLGCSLKWWYKDQLVIALLKQNLPALSEPQQKLSWETGEYFIGEQTRQFLVEPPEGLNLQPITPKGIKSSISKADSNRRFEKQAVIFPLTTPFLKSKTSHPSLITNVVVTPLGGSEKEGGKEIAKRGQPIQILGPPGTLKNMRGKRIEKQNCEASARRFNILLERLDLYSNSVVVNFKSPWQKYAYHRYVGVFPELNSESALRKNKNPTPRTPHRGVGGSVLPFYKYTFWEPPKNWFQISARGLCILDGEYLLKPGVFTFLKEPIKRTCKFPLNAYGETPQRVLASVVDFSSPLVCTSVDSNQLIDPQRYEPEPHYPQRGYIEDLKPKGGVTKGVKKLIQIEDLKSKQGTLKSMKENFNQGDKGRKAQRLGEIDEPFITELKPKTQSNKARGQLFAFLRSDSTILNTGLAELKTILGDRFLVEKHSYPLELTTTMSGWQPPVDTLILSSYLDEIPYKLQGILSSVVCKEESQFVSRITKPSSLLVNKKVTNWSNENETFLKNLQFIEIKQLLKNELQILIKSLPLTFVDKAFENRSYLHNKHAFPPMTPYPPMGGSGGNGNEKEQAHKDFENNLVDLGTRPEEAKFYTKFYKNKIDTENQRLPSSSLETPLLAKLPLLDYEIEDFNPMQGSFKSMENSLNSFSLLNSLGITFNNLSSLKVPPILLPTNRDASFWMWNKKKTGKVNIPSDNIANHLNFRLDPLALKWEVLCSQREKQSSDQSFKKPLDCANKITLKQKKTTIPDIDNINPIDNEVNVANKKAKLMSGYVYPDTQSNYLKSDLHRWIQFQFFGFLRKQNGLTLREEMFYKKPSTMNEVRQGWFTPIPPFGVASQAGGCEFFHLVNESPGFFKEKNELADLAIPYASGVNSSLLYPKMFRRFNRLMDKACLAGVEIPLIPRASQSTIPRTLNTPSYPPMGSSGSGNGMDLNSNQEHYNQSYGLAKHNSQEYLFSGTLSQNAKRAAFPILQNKRNTIDKKFHSTESSSSPLSTFYPTTEKSTFPNVVGDQWISSSGNMIGNGGTKVQTHPEPPLGVTIESFQAQNKNPSGRGKTQLSKKETGLWKIDNHLALFPGFIKPNKFLFSLSQIAQGNDISGNIIHGISKEHNATLTPYNPLWAASHAGGNKKNKFIIDCSPRKIAYRGIVAQRDKVTKDFQSPTKVLKLRSILGTALFGPENPLTDRQSHFFGQKRLSTIDTNGFQRDYLRQLGKETLTQSNPKGLVEWATSIERVKILSFSKAINSFSLKKRKYTYLLEENDQWHLLFQEQLRNALEDTRKYPPLTPVPPKGVIEAKGNGSGRIKVSAPLMMARIPKKRHSHKCIAQLPELTHGDYITGFNYFSFALPSEAMLNSRLDNLVHETVKFKAFAFKIPCTPKGIKSSISKADSNRRFEKQAGKFEKHAKSSLVTLNPLRGGIPVGVTKPLPEGFSMEDFKPPLLPEGGELTPQRGGNKQPPMKFPKEISNPKGGVQVEAISHEKEDHKKLGLISLQSISEFGQREYKNGFLVPKIISHYPLFTETYSSPLNSVPWLHKNSLPFFNNLQWFTQEPLNVNSWSIINQWSFLVALLFWIEQIFLGNIRPALFSLEQLLLGGTGMRSSDRTHVIRVSKGDTPKFQHIAGVDGLLGELAELVLFLRGHKERLWNKKSSCGVLLTGPPGTGKTFLVRALANEAKVPVLILSAGTLTTNKTNGSKPSWAIRHAFRRAKQLAPCILFIDEIDALGRSRGKIATDINEIVADTNVSQNQTAISVTPLSGSKLLQAAHLTQGISKEKSYSEIDHFSLCEDETSYLVRNGEGVEKNQTVTPSGGSGDKTQFNSKENTKRKFGPLTQLLVSMDGVSNLSGVLIMGATNRPESLDPALTRPGRFERIIRVEKPAEQKRIEILQLYSRNLGIQQQIPWSYLANRTVGLTAADLAVAMNYSSLKAIVQGSVHTIETIEYGLDSIARFSSTSSKNNRSFSLIKEMDNLHSFPYNVPQSGAKQRGKETKKEGLYPPILKNPITNYFSS